MAIGRLPVRCSTEARSSGVSVEDLFQHVEAADAIAHLPLPVVPVVDRNAGIVPAQERARMLGDREAVDRFYLRGALEHVPCRGGARAEAVTARGRFERRGDAAILASSAGCTGVVGSDDARYFRARVPRPATLRYSRLNSPVQLCRGQMSPRLAGKVTAQQCRCRGGSSSNAISAQEKRHLCDGIKSRDRCAAAAVPMPEPGEARR